jgi:hypothetical protein
MTKVKVMEYQNYRLGTHYEVFAEGTEHTTFRIIEKWYNMGWHQQTIAKCNLYNEALQYLTKIILNH